MTAHDYFVVSTAIAVLVLVLVLDIALGRNSRQSDHESEAGRQRLLREIRRQP